jgi:tetratricopeptide (TPR) repeat protein
MTPLELLNPPDEAAVARLLREATVPEVRQELTRLDESELSGAALGARAYAHGALALREGSLEHAAQAFDEAAAAFEASGSDEAAALARCEGWLARIRRGPRSVYSEASDALATVAAEAPWVRVQVVATHYRATALRYHGQAEATLGVLLEAFAKSDGLLSERAQVLNSLGTLYVVLGAHGAAESVLAHAAEINHQIGDRVSEAISYGQLGSAAVGRGDLEAAKRYLQKQEWFASRVGDNFGQARALVLLGDLAVDLGRADEAIELATKARDIASSMQPPLRMWIAYATRTIGRAKLEIGQSDAEEELEGARERFETMGNRLGEALVRWDLARLRWPRADGDRTAWFEAAWAFAALGLSGRVAQLLADLREMDGAEADRQLGLVLAATAQGHAHLAQGQEVQLVLTEPDTLAEIATRRIGGQRNLARLSAMTLADTGLVIAVIAAAGLGTGLTAMPSRRAEAALIGQLPGAAIWVWPDHIDRKIVSRDLASLRVTLGEDTRAVLGRYPDARVIATPFAGEVGATIEGADLGSYVAAAIASAPARLSVLPSLDWDREAEAIARLAGFAPAQD